MRGFTLIEVIAVLAVLSILAGVSAVAWVSHPRSAEAALLGSLAESRADAINYGRVMKWQQPGSTILFFPDGSSSGGDADTGHIHVDPLNGEAHVSH